ncbi:hypothetical protein VTN77DRAFT_6999 [Rasamsonia byssochlamydoides]|uniref:uncharacterized protein n=1 Tax=Rasamsonia byssochlamydoides TaxID=89139 RepID=UPI0037434197
MVRQAPRPVIAGSSQGQFTITFEKNPPSQVQPGAEFTMPVVVKVEPQQPREPDPNLELRLCAWLAAMHGSPTGILSGQFVDRIYDKDGDTMRGHVAFSRLKISQAGRYLFYVVLEIRDLEQNIPIEMQKAFANVIVDVNDTAPNDQVPSDEDITLFETLLAENQPGITDEDIQRLRDLRQQSSAQP